MATRLPGQSNADNTTTKLEIDIPTTKVINTQLCQTRTIFDLKKRKELMVSNHPSSAQMMGTFVSRHGRFVGALESFESVNGLACTYSSLV